MFSTPGRFFVGLCFFVGMNFHKKNKSTIQSILGSVISKASPHPKFTMSSPVVKIKKEMEMKNQTKTKIGVGSVVKAKVGELEKITREGRSRRMRK